MGALLVDLRSGNVFLGVPHTVLMIHVLVSTIDGFFLFCSLLVLKLIFLCLLLYDISLMSEKRKF